MSKETGWVIVLFKKGEQVERIEAQYLANLQDAIVHAARTGITEMQIVRKHAG